MYSRLLIHFASHPKLTRGPQKNGIAKYKWHDQNTNCPLYFYRVIFILPCHFCFATLFSFRRHVLGIPSHNIRHRLHNFGILQDCQNDYYILAVQPTPS